MKIGFIGQGWVGKNYADDFENRGYDVVRYSLEEPYNANKDKIASCDVVFIAVPTPTTPEGFDDSCLYATIPLVGVNKIAVIKSTILPGTTEKIQKQFPDKIIFHSPEFLVEKTAAFNATHPERNLIGIPIDTKKYQDKATTVLSILPTAPYQKIMRAKDAELIKYANNCFFYTKVVYMNILYDLVTALDGDWDAIQEAFIHDSRIGQSHIQPIHQSGRGAGGHCFIKDFEALRRLYKEKVKDTSGNILLEALKNKNIDLLITTQKDQEIIDKIYGK